MHHILKVPCENWRAIACGIKKFYMPCINDEDGTPYVFTVGDILELREFNVSTNKYTGNVLKAYTPYIAYDISNVNSNSMTNDIHYGLTDGYCILSINIESLSFKSEIAGTSDMKGW